MSRQILQFVAVTEGGRAFDIEFPLHPETRSAQSVSDLVTHLLQAISAHVQDRGEVSDGDILQALAMTAAIRGRMVGGDPTTLKDLTGQLYDEAWQAVTGAHEYPAGRA
jgi:hypothetical protein